MITKSLYLAINEEITIYGLFRYGYDTENLS